MNYFKKHLFILSVSAILLIPLFANPLMEFYLNELLLDARDDTAWQLEITKTPITADMYLTTLTDTALFGRPIMYNTDNFVVITRDSLAAPLHIRYCGDILQLHGESGAIMDQIGFGDVPDSEITVPKPGMSICRRSFIEGEEQHSYLYFDKSPTLGLANDSSNARGNCSGYVTDRSGHALDSVKVIYDSYSTSIGTVIEVYEYTDENGYYLIRDYARTENFHYKKDGYEDDSRVISNWPDSTILIPTVEMKETVNAISSKPDLNPNYFVLRQNYPNPFNLQTRIVYNLPLGDLVEMSIYELSGRRVGRLVSGFQGAGWHSVTWNAGNSASGIYIIRLQTSQALLSRKCLLIK